MHEHGLADQILHAALHHPDRPPQAVPRVLKVLVAELGGPAPEALQANLDHVCEHEGLPHIEIHVEQVPRLGACQVCQQTSPLGEDLTCPACGAAEVRLCGGETAIIRECEYVSRL
jgi:Zn finger protein HypA/HybF involved in hydrogenase expression